MSGGGNELGSPRRRVPVGKGRQRSVAAGLETVEPASLVFAGVSLAASGKQVLDDISGIARTGELVAIMGPSGAGKTTLLTALASGSGSREGRGGALSGLARLNGEEAPLGSLVKERRASFVTQEECLHPNLTVRETLLFAAELQLPASTHPTRVIRVEEVLRDLKLTHRSDDRVDILSGGERRRLSIGCDGLLTVPLLLFLDEPTSGLSSTDALEVVRCLRTLARGSNYSIVMSIHQPAADVFALFTRIILLAGGKLIFSGRRRRLPGFFRRAGCDIGVPLTPAAAGTTSPTVVSPFTPSLKEIETIADQPHVMIDWISVPEHANAIAECFRKSELFATLRTEIDQPVVFSSKEHEMDATDAAQAPKTRRLCEQIRVLGRREALCLWRGRSAFQAASFACLCSSVLFGAVFFQLDVTAGGARDRLNSLSWMIDAMSFVEPSWSLGYLAQRPRLRRDVAAGVVSPTAHTAVWAGLTLLRGLCCSFPVLTIGVAMVGYDWSVGSYAKCFFVVTMATVVLHSVLLLFTMNARSADAAQGVMGIFCVSRSRLTAFSPTFACRFIELFGVHRPVLVSVSRLLC